MNITKLLICISVGMSLNFTTQSLEPSKMIDAITKDYTQCIYPAITTVHKFSKLKLEYAGKGYPIMRQTSEKAELRINLCEEQVELSIAQRTPFVKTNLSNPIFETLQKEIDDSYKIIYDFNLFAAESLEVTQYDASSEYEESPIELLYSAMALGDNHSSKEEILTVLTCYQEIETNCGVRATHSRTLYQQENQN